MIEAMNLEAPSTSARDLRHPSPEGELGSAAEFALLRRHPRCPACTRRLILVGRNVRKFRCAGGILCKVALSEKDGQPVSSCSSCGSPLKLVVPASKPAFVVCPKCRPHPSRCAAGRKVDVGLLQRNVTVLPKKTPRIETPRERLDTLLKTAVLRVMRGARQPFDNLWKRVEVQEREAETSAATVCREKAVAAAEWRERSAWLEVLAKVLLRRGDLAMALEAASAAVQMLRDGKHDRRLAIALHRRAEILDIMEMHVEATRCLEEALTVDPTESVRGRFRERLEWRRRRETRLVSFLVWISRGWIAPPQRALWRSRLGMTNAGEGR